MKVFFDLVMENGELVRLEVPRKFEDDCHGCLENQMKIRGWFSTARWKGCQATYMGMTLDRVNMGKVVALLQ